MVLKTYTKELYKMSLQRRASFTGEYTRSQHLDFQTIFNVFDEDHDGKLQSDDVIRAIRSLGHVISQRVADDIITDLDCDNEGECEYKEFIRILENLEKVKVSRRALVEGFQALDDSGRGQINKPDLQHILSVLGGEPLSEEDMADFLHQACTTTDGDVDIRRYCDKMFGKTRRRLSLFGQGAAAYEA
eukprot:m.294028 g.294028  ORF g.294028 m.294028 type:complete len:188 (-) comp20026_c0_seq28:2031-2594(-)